MKISAVAIVALFAVPSQGFNLNYMGSLGGGSAMKSGTNYNGFNPTKTVAKVSTPAPEPYVSSVADAPASSGLNYMGSLGGGSAMKSGKNYNGFKSIKAVGNSVISAPAAAAYVSAVVNAPVSNSLNYMGSLGGGSAMKSGKNYNGFKSIQSTGNSATSAPAPAPQVSAVANSVTTAPVSNGLNYMGSLGGGSAMKSGKNYNGFKSIQSTGNIAASVPDAAPQVSAVASSVTTAPVSNGLNYMGSLGGGSAMKSGKNYNGFNSIKSAGNSATSAPEPAPQVSAVASSAVTAPASNGLNYMGSLGGGSAMKSGKNYAVSNTKFGPIKSDVSTPAAAPYVAPVVAAAPVTNSLDYVGSLGGGSAMKSGKNFSAFGSSKQVGSVSSLESSFAAASYVAPTPAPVSSGSYLENISGEAVSSSYNSMQGSFAAATGAEAPKSTVAYLQAL